MSIYRSPAKRDYNICEQILEKLGIAHLRNKDFSRISSGERQMVLIARALAQEPALLMMDEPTSNLDFGNQVNVLQQIINLARDHIGIIMTTHAPDQAFLCASDVAFFGRDKKIAYGCAEETITEDSMQAAYGVKIRINEITEKGRVIRNCIPLLKTGQDD